MLPLDFPHRLGWTESNDGFEADCNFIAALGGLLLLVGGLLFWGGGMTFRTRPTTCEACDGTGETASVHPIRGEAVDADYGTSRCQDCEGSGTLDAACAGCNVIQPLNEDGECEECARLVMPVRGRSGLWL